MIVSCSDMKKHLNVVGDDDNALIESKIVAAQEHLESLLGYEIEEEYSVSPDTVPPALKQAVMMLAAHWYENREATIVGVSAQEMPLGVWDIVNEHRKWGLTDG